MRIVMSSLLLAVVPTAAHTQTSQNVGVVAITISDPNGALIQGAAVAVKSTADVSVGSAKTNKSGEALFMLKQGTYQISVTARGFSDLRESIQVTASGDQHLSFRMQVDPKYGGYQGPCCFDVPLKTSP